MVLFRTWLSDHRRIIYNRFHLEKILHVQATFLDGLKLKAKSHNSCFWHCRKNVSRAFQILVAELIEENQDLQISEFSRNLGGQGPQVHYQSQCWASECAIGDNLRIKSDGECLIQRCHNWSSTWAWTSAIVVRTTESRTWGTFRHHGARASRINSSDIKISNSMYADIH